MSRALPLLAHAEPAARAPRKHADAPSRVALLGFEDQDNLGLRYLAARLRQAGHEPRLFALRGDDDVLLAELQAFAPSVIGFSLIFQFLVPQFAELMSALRGSGMSAHFTIGGHYASFEPEALLQAIPELDSVVRFEGEETLLELVETLAAGCDLHDVRGIAFRNGGQPVITDARAGRDDLDELPWPERDDIRYEHMKLPLASIIGGRGCPWRCSFCSIVTFYAGNGTKGRRRRAPERVVDEIADLARRGARILLWQDDDFLAGGRAAIGWAHEIAHEVTRRGLHRSLRWKISCRSDEVKASTLEPLVAAGLSHVYLGVEAGDDDDLRNLDKRLDAGAHLRAKEILQALELSFDFGFMLLEPWSTLDTVGNNLSFLRAFAGDGSAAISFCRTLPYAGTPIEARLRREGRLAKHSWCADYRFLDPRLDVLYDWGLSAFASRNHGSDGSANLLRVLLFEANLDLPGQRRDHGALELARSLTSLSNQVLLDTLESALDYLRALGPEDVQPDADDPVLVELAHAHLRQDARIRADLALLARHYPQLNQHLSVGQ